MKLVFAAGDVGGARALLPVAWLAAAEGETVIAMEHGVFHAEGDPQWTWMSPEDVAREAGTADAVLYATSVSDHLAVEIAQAARTNGRPVLHLLDNWSNYANRIAKLVPDAYAVMDPVAFEEAVADGVPRDLLAITGHPDLAKLPKEAEAFGAPEAWDGKTSLFFASEPAAADGGPKGRGYDEVDVARALIEGIVAVPGTCQDSILKVAPHPREERAIVTARFESLAAETPNAPQIHIVAPNEVRRSLHGASHVAGMSSILLYEAWLLGRAVLSLQPGLAGGGLSTLSRRDGVIFHTAQQGTAGAVAMWLARRPNALAPDLRLHRSAARNVLRLARKLSVSAAK